MPMTRTAALAALASRSEQHFPPICCPNCLATWLAARPQPRDIFCWHYAVLLTPTTHGWRAHQDVDRGTAAALRAQTP